MVNWNRIEPVSVKARARDCKNWILTWILRDFTWYEKGAKSPMCVLVLGTTVQRYNGLISFHGSPPLRNGQRVGKDRDGK